MQITLATLPEATAQQVFDHVAKHLLTQARKSELPGDSCLYRLEPENSDESVLMCAAGCLMSESEYHPRFEGLLWDLLVVKEREVPSNHTGLINDLQSIHDLELVSAWPQKLRELAARRELQSQVVYDLEPAFRAKLLEV